MEIAEIPAPPFAEDARAAHVESGFRDAGLSRVERDGAGNVLGLLPGEDSLPPVLLSAHLDTVFPAGTDSSIRLIGNCFTGPSIMDDSRGLAALLAVARSVVLGGARPHHPLLFVGTVGEEGPGDLRGVKHLFGENGAARACHGFISLDGAGLGRIVVRGIGSIRLRFRLTGPGGHSWSDWGEPNPLHLLARGVDALTKLPLPATPRTTLTVARWGGGRSINSIPDEGWIEVDLRSEDGALLADLERRVRRHMQEATQPEGPGSLRLSVEEIGRRPAGATEAHAPLVVAALAASRVIGTEPLLSSSSTDANIPMSLGIPALTMGAGGEGGRAHTMDEWYRNTRGPEGVVRALLTCLAVAGVSPEP